MRHSPTESLYQYMKSVYEPLLVGESSELENVSPQMKSLVSSLKAGLATTLRKGVNRRSVEDVDNFEGILSPIDEIEFWAELERMNVQTNSEEKVRQKAEFLNSHLKNLAKLFYELDSMKLVKVNDLLDILEDTIDDIWISEEIEPHYGEPRMKHFLKICTASIGAKIEKELTELDVWSSPFSDVRMKIMECMNICKSWREKMSSRTGGIWKQEK